MGVILKKTIRKDITLYNQISTDIENNINLSGSRTLSLADFAWKQLDTEVFRAPYKLPGVLAIFLGTGIQILCVIISMISIGIFMFFNPIQRSMLINVAIIIFILMSIPSGFATARFYKFFNGKRWFLVSLGNCIIFPGVIIISYIIIQMLLKIENTNNNLKVKDVAFIFLLWFFCSSPLVLIGSFIGIKMKKMYVPCKPNLLPASIHTSRGFCIIDSWPF